MQATLVAQQQSEQMQHLSEASLAQNREMQGLSEANIRQTEDSKKVSAWAEALYVPTLIGTIYGMNFTNMPELRWRDGYPLAVVAMIVRGVGLYIAFRKKRWL